VVATRVMLTKRGSKMGLLTLDDKSARLEVMLFTEAFEKFNHLLEKDRILICEGEVSFDDFAGGNRMTARNIIDISEARSHFAKALEIDLAAAQLSPAGLDSIEQAMTPWRNGAVPVLINYSQAEARGQFRLADSWRVNPTDELVFSLESILGPNKVRIVF
ncbi:MAG: OB-fold nucleic acid binding domain-containing protein, partial [Shewanella sp.]